MKNHSIFPIILLFVLPIFISCLAKTPVPDLQQPQAFNIEDLALSDILVKNVESGDEEKYVIYTFYTTLNKEKIHKQYWEGIIVFDDLPVPDQTSESTDSLGIKTVDWRENPLRKSYSKDVYNVQGLLYKRTTINPDGSSIDAVDLNGDGIVDYMEAILPNGDITIIATERLGMDFLDEILKGVNPYCDYSGIFGVSTEELPGCDGQSSSGSSSDSGFGLGIGAAGSGNPYHDLMEGMCSGYERSGAASFSGATYTRNLTGVERNSNWRRIADRTHVRNTVTEHYDDTSSRTFVTEVVTEDDGTVTFNTTKIDTNPDGSSTEIGTGVTYSPDGSTRTDHYTTQHNDGSSTERHTSTTTRPDGSTTTRHTSTTTRPDDSYTQRSSETTRRADGISTATPITETECSSDGTCSEPEPIPTGSETEHPGFEPDPDSAMAEFCEIWNQSKEDRPNDISELNKSANEERCSIAPDESASSDGSSLAETCYFDIVGRDEIAELVAGGTCVTAAGGAYFDYDSENPGRCTQNKFFILERGLLMNGASGVSAAELCKEDLACDPADF